MTLADAFHEQARACEALGSPFMARLLTGLADSWSAESDLGRRVLSWTGDLGPHGASLPLRIAGGLHALVLSGTAPDLAGVYPPHDSPDAVLMDRVQTALVRHEDFMMAWIEHAPQTNEVRRSVALIPAAHLIAARYPRPIALSELGASGGLNLMFDHFALETPEGRLGPSSAALTLTPEWEGPLPPAARLQIADRRGVDLNPLDPRNDADALRLRAYLWPDQPHRMELTRSAIAVHDATLDAGDAIDWLEQRLSSVPQGHLHMIYHTVAWQYFPPEVQARGAALIEAAGRAATDDAPLAWVSMETDGQSSGAALLLRLWPGDLHVPLGRADFHGRWVRWEAPDRLP